MSATRGISWESLQVSSNHLKKKNEKKQLLLTTFTSSTAQGGGGSFKNRKPIGEIGCCDSGMAERSH